VDTSVGEVVFSPLATIKGSAGPWPLDVGDILSATTNTGTGTTAALAAAAATVTGSGAALGTIVGGDTFTLRADHGPVTTITFGAADITIAAVVARINNTLGATVATNAAGQLALTGLCLGTGGQLVRADVTAGCLAKLGHTAATTNGTGNVANLASVTPTEVAALVNASASMTSANVKARLGADGALWLYHLVSATASTIQVDAGTGGMGLAMGFTIDVDATIALNAAGTIPAGTRVQASGTAGTEWVTMQSLEIPAGEAGPFPVRIRPGLDNGTHVGVAISGVNTLVDAPAFAAFAISNPAAITAALTEGQKDAAYKEALDATLNELGICREANYLLIARCSDSVKREGRANAVLATEIGMFGRKYLTGDMLGSSPDESIAAVASYRRDRVFYSALALKVKIPVIAERGTAGGQGFTADGIITVRPDGPLCTLCARLPPEENPGQQTNLIDDFFAVNAYGESITIDTYKAFRRNGICAPRVDRTAGTIFQSGVTSSLISGEGTIARRRMADFIQDSAIGIWLPYSKKIAREAVRMRALAKWNQFLAGLESAQNPEKSRIHSWSTDDGINAGNTNTTLALGAYYVLTKVKTHPSLDFIVLQTEIGENAIITKTL
jgi:hypothetical protein